MKDPEASPIVYMMFAEHPLAKKKPKEFQDGKDDALAMRMQLFGSKGFLASKGGGPGGIHTVKIDEVEGHGLDYNKDYFPFLAYKDKVTGVNADHSMFGLRPRHYMVAELGKRFAKWDSPYGIALAFWDPVGIYAELNNAGNVMIARETVAGVGDEKKTRERVIADLA